MTSVPFSNLEVDVDGSYMLEHSKATIVDTTHKIEITTNSHVSPQHGNKATIYICQTHLKSNRIGDIEMDLPNAVQLLTELEEAVQILEAIAPDSASNRADPAEKVEPWANVKPRSIETFVDKANRTTPEADAAACTAWMARMKPDMSTEDLRVFHKWAEQTLNPTS